MIYELPTLPYEVNDLAPVISKETIEYHYGKHEKTYIDNLNKLIEGTPFAQKTIEEIIKEAEGPLFNNASQAWNHIFYFFTFSPEGRRAPQGELAEAIDRQWGNFENFQKEFEQAGVSLFGSGWVWLSKDREGKLVISKENNAGSPLTKGLIPLLTFDVWEHAYYIDYRNRRAEHLHKLWEIVDWSVVESRYL
ncbi:MAG TPA: superoxide dismutase [Candidatus Barnesiella excrementigallinarum]|nr:superoxide dismutase [Candidatus Barnesiella excrementigallinarum]